MKKLLELLSVTSLLTISLTNIVSCITNATSYKEEKGIIIPIKTGVNKLKLV